VRIRKEASSPSSFFPQKLKGKLRCENDENLDAFLQILEQPKVSIGLWLFVDFFCLFIWLFRSVEEIEVRI